MTTQRNDLAREIFIADNSGQSREASLKDWEWFATTNIRDEYIGRYEAFADGLIAAGWTKPRTISTVTRERLVNALLAYKGTPRHRLFEYPHRVDDSRRMIQEAESVVTAISAGLYETTEES